MKNLFITGAHGYIGRNLVDYLSSKNHLFTPTHKELELLDTEKVHKYIAGNRINYIVHTANVGGARTDLDKTNIVPMNLRMFFNIVRNVRYVEKIIYLGSGAEYDKSRPLKNITEEDFDKKIPNDDYGFYKYICSKYIEAKKDKKIISLRLFGTYGKYDNYLVRFVTNSILKNIFHQPINISQNVYFDYLFIEDLVRIVDYFLVNSSEFNIYNITSGKKVDLITIAKAINEISDYKSRITIQNSGLNIEYTGSNSRFLQEAKNFKFTPLKEGIRRLYYWYKANLDKVDKENVIEDKYIKYCKVKKLN